MCTSMQGGNVCDDSAVASYMVEVNFMVVYGAVGLCCSALCLVPGFMSRVARVAIVSNC